MDKLATNSFAHWESTKDEPIRMVVCGEKITIDQTLIAQQFGVNVEGTVDVANTLVKETQVALKKHSCTRCICQPKTMEHNSGEGGISRQVCSFNPANHLPIGKVSLF
jgi:hypothetical protein